MSFWRNRPKNVVFSQAVDVHVRICGDFYFLLSEDKKFILKTDRVIY